MVDFTPKDPSWIWKARSPKDRRRVHRGLEMISGSGVWNQANALPAGLPRISDQSDDIRTPSQRIYEALGSSTNPSHFTLLQNGINAVKNSLENFKRPMAPARFNREIASALVGDEMAIRTIMAPLREVRYFLHGSPTKSKSLILF